LGCRRPRSRPGRAVRKRITWPLARVGVATQRDFHGGGEPAQAKSAPDPRRRAGKAVPAWLFSAARGLHPRRLWPGRERLDDAGGISPERTRSEGVDHPLAHALVLRRDSRATARAGPRLSSGRAGAGRVGLGPIRMAKTLSSPNGAQTVISPPFLQPHADGRRPARRKRSRRLGACGSRGV